MKKDHQKIINYIQPSLYDVSDTIFIHTTENFGRNYENVLRENYFRDFIHYVIYIFFNKYFNLFVWIQNAIVLPSF